MRVVIVGASPLAIATANDLLKRKHDVVIVERNRDKIEALTDQIACGFIHGDGSKPAILREVDPAESDCLLSLTNHDQDNILASLVGRSLGFRRVIPKIEDPEFEHICVELGLTDTIVPDQSIARTLADLVTGQEFPELSTIIKGEVRFFSFIAGERDAGLIGELKLPDEARAICVYHTPEDFEFARDKTKIVKGDEVVLITHSRNLTKLGERWVEGSGA